MRKGLLTILVVLIFALNSSAQLALSNPVLPNLPPSIKWQQINSPHFRIIFTEGFENEAQNAANVFERIYGPASQSLGADPRKFPVVLQNHHALSNGMVTIAPYRSELFTLAPQAYQSLGNDLWMERLIAHEYRHIVQFEKVITPFNKVMYALFGEYVPGFWAGISTPAWFFEGDAVGLETAMGRSGRGRAPSFLMPFKANTIEKGGFNYYKQYLKSFRDFVPNHYVTGYLMTTHLKNEHGPDIWGKVTHHSFSKPYIPFTFSNALKKETGNYLVNTYKEMLDHQRDLYENQLSSITPTPFQKINSLKKDVYANYSFPQKVHDDKILCIKSGMGDIPQIVLLDSSGQEEKIFEMGPYVSTEYLSSNDSVVVWIERAYDPRWRNRTYMEVKKLNFLTGVKTDVTKKTRYTAAAISKDGSKIIATYQSSESENNLHLLDAQSGNVLWKMENPENYFYSMPQLIDDGTFIALRHFNDGKQIVKIDSDSNSLEVLFYSNEENLGNPVIEREYLYFNSNFDGIDNIYAMNLENKKIYQVTSSKYGAFNPSFSEDGKTIYYNDYSVDGLDIVKTQWDSSKWTLRPNVKNVSTGFEKVMVENEAIGDVLYDSLSENFEVNNYSKLGHSFRPTSWGLTIRPPDTGIGLTPNEYSFGLSTQDILSSMTFDALVSYNSTERAWRYTFDLSYQALYPILDFGVDLGSRSAVFNDENGNKKRYFWNENGLNAGFRLPFLLTNSKYSKSLSISSNVGIYNVSNYNVPNAVIGQNGNGSLYTLNSSISFARVLRTSKLDVGPRWGQSLRFTSKQTPFGGDYQSAMYATQANLFFPSIFKHHSINFRGGYQYQDVSNYYFSTAVLYTRGYLYTPFEKFSNLSANYKLPLAYMDWHLGPIINFQRVYTNLFFDYGIGRQPEQSDRHLKSIGAEVSFNFNLIRNILLFDMGFRYSYLPEEKSGTFQFILGAVTF